MNAFIGKVRNKSQARRETKNYLFFKELIEKQSKELIKEVQLNKDGIKDSKTDKE